MTCHALFGGSISLKAAAGASTSAQWTSDLNTEPKTLDLTSTNTTQRSVLAVSEDTFSFQKKFSVKIKTVAQ